MEIPHLKYNLGINTLSYGAMTCLMFEAIEKIILGEKLDLLMDYGDLNSTLAGALPTSKLLLNLARIKVGLHSFIMQMREEIDWILTDRLSSYLFSPTQTAIDNFKNGCFMRFNCQVELIGDVRYSAALCYSQKYAKILMIIVDLELRDSFILFTLHLQENTDDLQNLSANIKAFNELGKTHKVIFSLHSLAKRIIQQAGLIANFKVIDPVGYFDMIELLKHCFLVITDSGGLQKEAYFFQKNCVTLRGQTEWVELINYGFNVLTGAKKEEIILQAVKMLQKENDFSNQLYGDGNARMRIGEYLINSH